jgi:hypothetical protein
MYLVTILITGITMVPGMLLTTRRQRLRRWPEGLAGTADLGTMGVVQARMERAFYVFAWLGTALCGAGTWYEAFDWLGWIRRERKRKRKRKRERLGWQRSSYHEHTETVRTII